jgi:hypothetical protein
MKSPTSIRNGRFHLPKCRGKVQKMGVLGPSPNFQITPKKSEKNQKIAKYGRQQGSNPQFVRLWAVANRRPLVASRP